MSALTFKKSSIIILAAAIFCVVVFFSSLPFLVKPAFLEKLIRDRVEKQLGYTPSFKRFELSLFPVPVIHFYSFSLASRGPAAQTVLKADRTSFRLSVLSLAFGKVELAQVSLKNADLRYLIKAAGAETREKVLSFEKTNADFYNIRSGQPVRFKIRGNLLGNSGEMAASGTMVANFEKFHAKDLELNAQITCGSADLPKLADWWGQIPFRVHRGFATAQLKIAKSRASPEFGIDGHIKIQDFVYELQEKSSSSAPAEYDLKFKGKYDLEKQQFSVKEGVLAAPFGSSFLINGQYRLGPNIIEELFVKSEALKLEKLPQYILPLERMLPVNMGFSGESRLDFYAKGDPKILTLNLRIDSTQANLTYSKYFSKSIGTPFIFRGDGQLAAGRAFRGNFSLEFEQAKLEGSIVDYDVVSGIGELTVLTNKLGLEGWQKYFPPLRDFTLSGGMKFLLSVKGNFNHLNEARFMNHLNFDQVQLTGPNGAEIKNLTGSIDLGPLDSEIRDFSFEIGNSVFSMAGKMLQRPDTHWLLDIRSPEFDVRDLIARARALSDALQLDELKINWKSIEQSIGFIRAGESFGNLEMQVVYGVGRISVPALRFQAYDGTVSGNAVYDFSKAVPASAVEIDLNHLSLIKMADPAKPAAVEGNLFAHVSLSADGPIGPEWAGRLNGNGTLSVTNGEFNAFDLLGGLGQIAELATLANYKSGTTRFNDIRANFRVADQKVESKDVMLVSDDGQINAEGDISFEGKLNFRLGVFLAGKLAKKIAPRTEENQLLGPIPLLLVGTIDHPQIQKDPVLIQNFLDHLLRDQLSKILSKGSNEKSQAPASAVTQKQTEKPKKLQDALIESGFGLLQQILEEKKNLDSSQPAAASASASSN